MPVEITVKAAKARRLAPGLRRNALKLLALSNLSDRELSVVLVGDRQIAELNSAYRDKPVPTDVLAFSQVEEASAAGKKGRLPRGLKPGKSIPPHIRHLGDVVISVDTALRQALETDLPLADRMRTLLAHGFLHLLGYDHERSPADARVMFARQRRLESHLAGHETRLPPVSSRAGTRSS